MSTSETNTNELCKKACKCGAGYILIKEEVTSYDNVWSGIDRKYYGEIQCESCDKRYKIVDKHSGFFLIEKTAISKYESDQAFLQEKIMSLQTKICNSPELENILEMYGRFLSNQKNVTEQYNKASSSGLTNLPFQKFSKQTKQPGGIAKWCKEQLPSLSVAAIKNIANNFQSENFAVINSIKEYDNWDQKLNSLSEPLGEEYFTLKEYTSLKKI